MASKGSVNKVVIVGNLGSDPERKDVNDTSLTTFSLATSESWSKDGEKVEKTEWHRCVAWRKVADIIGEHSKKGDKLYIEGKLQTRSYDKDGQTHYSTEIVVDDFTFLSGRGDSGSASAAPQEVAVGDDLPF
jgi:single-strand DNA-binding protein|tara:strand:+ start:681 stop:1076 length:396 start_codon:yes stop_codon:yes gene_type:complete